MWLAFEGNGKAMYFYDEATDNECVGAEGACKSSSADSNVRM